MCSRRHIRFESQNSQKHKPKASCPPHHVNQQSSPTRTIIEYEAWSRKFLKILLTLGDSHTNHVPYKTPIHHHT